MTLSGILPTRLPFPIKNSKLQNECKKRIPLTVSVDDKIDDVLIESSSSRD